MAVKKNATYIHVALPTLNTFPHLKWIITGLFTVTRKASLLFKCLRKKWPKFFVVLLIVQLAFFLSVTYFFGSVTVPSQLSITPGANLSLFVGRPPQRIELAESLRLDKIHIVIKTSAKFHHSRLELILLTWLQTTPPSNVSTLKVVRTFIGFTHCH